MHMQALLFVLLMFCASIAQADTIEQQRAWFEEARLALNNDDSGTFKSIKEKLGDYPLVPYLDIWMARQHLDKGNDDLVAEVLKQHAQIPESSSLRIAWLKQLAQKGKWAEIIKLLDQHPSDSSRLPEIAMVAAWHRGEKATAITLYSEHWINARKSSSYSESLHRQWEKSGHPTHEERWQRINQHINSGSWRKAKNEALHLPKVEQPLIGYWQKVQSDPEKMLLLWPEKVDTIPATMILKDGLVRLARNDAGRAWLLLPKLETKVSVADEVLADLKQNLALRAARQHRIEAVEWLAALPESHKSEETRNWQIRLLILDGQWEKTITAIDALPDRERKQSNWIYWKARALEINGEKKLAEPLYLLLANSRGYYSFLSSERLGLPLKFNSNVIEGAPADIEALSRLPAVQRAYEWLQLGHANKASAEWYAALRNSNRGEWRAAIHLASSWGWHDQAIRAAAKASEPDALEVRFPLGFEDAVAAASKESGLDSSSIWSIIRQESAFNFQAVSYAGARGLMQLMPATARDVAKKIKHPSRHPDLFSPDTNVRLGSTYLAQMKERFGSLALAAAAYNAGPHRVSLWVERSPFNGTEAWIEAIPFNETRRYVQQVMAFIAVYEWRQAKTPSSLIARIRGDETVSLKAVN
ncbi:soluble lytic murein transglycosylase [Mariprofundus ferrinatatus]|uniref:Soluble lytic murein transglycosylase n=2 Tax=Mariprofundus ferrinatatus TaxID=1921087 RepID=A0A2K8L687_9PROT|nr:soluble lytic murein transglycosylase [Mariprofundus ferrinatatus]